MDKKTLLLGSVQLRTRPSDQKFVLPGVHFICVVSIDCRCGMGYVKGDTNLSHLPQ